jgi:DNA-binding CsgD family transcriptional regulator
VPILELRPREVRLLELLEAGRSARQIAQEFDARQEAVEMHVIDLARKMDASSQADLIATWRRNHEAGHPERVHLPEIDAHTPGAYRCPNPECEYGGKWARGKMVPNQDRKFICVGCYSVYDVREITDRESEDDGRHA